MAVPHPFTAISGEPARYEIRIKGHLDDRWAIRFGGLSLTRFGDGTTLLAGPVVDQAALHSLLRTVRDLGLHLISVYEVSPKTAGRVGATGGHQASRFTVAGEPNMTARQYAQGPKWADDRPGRMRSAAATARRPSTRSPPDARQHGRNRH